MLIISTRTRCYAYFYVAIHHSCVSKCKKYHYCCGIHQKLWQSWNGLFNDFYIFWNGFTLFCVRLKIINWRIQSLCHFAILKFQHETENILWSYFSFFFHWTQSQIYFKRERKTPIRLWFNCCMSLQHRDRCACAHTTHLSLWSPAGRDESHIFPHRKRLTMLTSPLTR